MGRQNTGFLRSGTILGDTVMVNTCHYTSVSTYRTDDTKSDLNVYHERQAMGGVSVGVLTETKVPLWCKVVTAAEAVQLCEGSHGLYFLLNIVMNLKQL